MPTFVLVVGEFVLGGLLGVGGLGVLVGLVLAGRGAAAGLLVRTQGRLLRPLGTIRLEEKKIISCIKKIQTFFFFKSKDSNKNPKIFLFESKNANKVIPIFFRNFHQACSKNHFKALT